MGMLKKIQYSLVFNRKKLLNKNQKALIQIRAYQNGKSIYFSTGIYINPKFWDQKKLKIKHSHPNQFKYNQQIIEQLQDLESFEIRMINRYGHIPLDRLKEYNSSSQYNQPLSFTRFFKQELTDRPLKTSSLKMYKQSLKILRRMYILKKFLMGLSQALIGTYTNWDYIPIQSKSTMIE